MGKLKDLTNKKFGKVTILSRTNKPNSRSNKSRDSFWLGLCECGSQKIYAGGDIQKINFKGCGCSRKNINANQAKMGTAMYIYKNRYSDGDISFEDFLKMSNEYCFYCGAAPYKSFNLYKLKDGCTKLSAENGYFTYNGLDRIDQNLPHFKNNVVTCCAICNWMKTNHSSYDFIKHITKIYFNLTDLKENPVFVKISSSGLKESNAHDLIIGV